jgi:predicted MFS family arabinose efflux permease
MLATAVLVVVGVALVIGRFLAVQEQPEDHVRPSAWSAWREPRTLAIGLVVMCFALCEGIANDWLALGIVDGYGAAPALGSFGYALFVVAMTTGRFFGGGLATRFGRVLVLRATALLVVAGSLVVVLSPSLPFAFVGALLWGVGASLGFPMGMTAAADEESHAATRVAVVSSIGYCAFLGGPPLVGALGEKVGVLDSLLVAVVAALGGLAATRAMAPVAPEPEPADQR